MILTRPQKLITVRQWALKYVGKAKHRYVKTEEFAVIDAAMIKSITHDYVEFGVARDTEGWSCNDLPKLTTITYFDGSETVYVINTPDEILRKIGK